MIVRFFPVVRATLPTRLQPGLPILVIITSIQSPNATHPYTRKKPTTTSNKILRELRLTIWTRKLTPLDLKPSSSGINSFLESFLIRGYCATHTHILYWLWSRCMHLREWNLSPERTNPEIESTNTTNRANYPYLYSPSNVYTSNV